jgi:hypothetical protein
MTRFILKTLIFVTAAGTALPAYSAGLSERDCRVILGLGQGAVRSDVVARCRLAERREEDAARTGAVARAPAAQPQPQAERPAQENPVVAVDGGGLAAGEEIVAVRGSGKQLRVAVYRNGRLVWLKAGKGLRARLGSGGTPLADVNLEGPASGRVVDVGVDDGIRARVGGDDPLVDVNTGGPASGDLADVGVEDGPRATVGGDEPLADVNTGGDADGSLADVGTGDGLSVTVGADDAISLR